MSTNPFHFKQFTIHQEMCAMKVGTDGVVLGAWTDPQGASRILDIGTGSGLLALMMAQKSADAEITGIDPDENAFRQASENAAASKWRNRIVIKKLALQDFIKEEAAPFELIISNPPYFSNSKKAPDKRRSLARHNDELSLHELLAGAGKLVAEKGRVNIILPVDQMALTESLALAEKLFPTGRTMVTPVPGKPPKRVLLQFEKSEKLLQENELTIETGKRHEYTEEFKAMARDFYLRL